MLAPSSAFGTRFIDLASAINRAAFAPRSGEKVPKADEGLARQRRLDRGDLPQELVELRIDVLIVRRLFGFHDERAPRLENDLFEIVESVEPLPSSDHQKLGPVDQLFRKPLFVHDAVLHEDRRLAFDDLVEAPVLEEE